MISPMEGSGGKCFGTARERTAAIFHVSCVSPKWSPFVRPVLESYSLEFRSNCARRSLDVYWSMGRGRGQGAQAVPRV